MAKSGMSHTLYSTECHSSYVLHWFRAAD